VRLSARRHLKWCENFSFSAQISSVCSVSAANCCAISSQPFRTSTTLNCNTRYNLLMEFLDKIVEERIQRAQADGLFDNLPGKGKPLKLDDDSFVPEDLRLTYKILKNSNCLPVEMELRKQIFNLRQLLNAAIDEETRRELRRELNVLVLKFNVKQRRAICVDQPEAPPDSPRSPNSHL
jgi:Domain of unknown function (DUF1992)